MICKDAQTRQLLAESLQALAISPEICDEVFAANRLLNRQKFEAVIVDLQLGEEASLVMEQLRFSPANRTAVTFAITARDREPNRIRHSYSHDRCRPPRSIRPCARPTD